jgi:hypothetical protein
LHHPQRNLGKNVILNRCFENGFNQATEVRKALNYANTAAAPLANSRRVNHFAVGVFVGLWYLFTGLRLLAFDQYAQSANFKLLLLLGYP